MENVGVCGKGVRVCTEVYISRICTAWDCLGLYVQYVQVFTF